MKKNKIVYIVHAVDTEGPLYESTNATFKRIEELFNLKFKVKSKKKLENLFKGIGLPKKLNKKKFFSAINPHLLKYNKNWNEIKKMVNKINEKKFRNKLLDSKGKNWKFSWHCVDHIGYKFNPRKRSIGYHKIFDFYKNLVNKKKNLGDKVHFHFHPMTTYKEAHRNSKSYFNSSHLYEVIARRIIDRNWFPTSFRAGFHIERPDINLFLEQFIPYDLSNTSIKSKKNKIDNSTNAEGWDWRRATKKWEIYNPDHDDYQSKGRCRRYIGRVLSIKNRTESINLPEVLKAFKQANKGIKTLMAVTSHDFRNIATEVDEVRNFIIKAKKKYPNVKFNYVDTSEGFRNTLNFKMSKKSKLKLGIKMINKNSFKIFTKSGEVFGPQPFLALKFKNGRYMSDNLDFGLNKKVWYYTLNEDTVLPKDIKVLAVGAADKFGNYDVCRYFFN